MIHWLVSFEQHVAAGNLTAGQALVLSMLWGEVRNPFAGQPVVWSTYEHLARRTGLKASYIAEVTAALQSAGCLLKGKTPVPGKGLEYTLLRPKHEPDDAKRNPFDPSEAETAAEAAVEMLRADNRTARAEKKPKRKREPKPAIKPSDIALAIEDAAGIKRKENRKPHNRHSAGKKQPMPWIAAAQNFIAAHGKDAFDRVCAAAKLRNWAPQPDSPIHAPRIYLFDPQQADFVAGLLKPTGKLRDWTPYEVATSLHDDGEDFDAALARVTTHWAELADMTPAEFNDWYDNAEA